MFVPVEDEAVGIVVDHEDVVLAGKLYDAFVEFPGSPAARWHVGIVGPHHLHTGEVHGLQLPEIRLPAVLLQKIVIDNLLPQEFGQRRVSRISGIGHQHFVPGIAERQRNMQDALLAANQRLYLRGGIKLHAVPATIESRHGFTKLGNAHCGLIAVRVVASGLAAQHVNRGGRRRHVGTADGQRDDVLAFCVETGHLFQFATEVVLLYEIQSVCRSNHIVMY